MRKHNIEGRSEISELIESKEDEIRDFFQGKKYKNRMSHEKPKKDRCIKCGEKLEGSIFEQCELGYCSNCLNQKICNNCKIACFILFI
jgi:hypothetical protein